MCGHNMSVFDFIKDNNIELFSVEEITEKTGWKEEKNYEEESSKFYCCDEEVYIGGIFGAEYAYCEKCGKRIQNISGIHITGNSTCTFFEISDEEAEKLNDKLWYIILEGNKK